MVRYSDYPEAARSLPRVGDASRLDIERLLVIKPDLVLGWSSGNPAGDLMRLVTWLANHAAERTGGLRAGDFVTTGSFIGMQPVGPSAAVEIRLSGVGNARVRFV